MSENQLIEVRRLPVIIAKIDEIGSLIDTKIQQAENLVVTSESRQTIKKIKAELNKEKETYEEIRKNIKRQILKPFEDVEMRFKSEITTKFEQAYTILNNKVKAFDDIELSEKEREVREYFSECLKSNNIDFVTYEQSGINVTLSNTDKALKMQAKAFVDKIANDLKLIETQANKVEILVEYKKSLDISSAVIIVTQRNKAIEAELTKAQAMPVLPEKPLFSHLYKLYLLQPKKLKRKNIRLIFRLRIQKRN